MSTLTLDRLKAVLSYDPGTGLFRHRLTKGRAIEGMVAGKIARRRGGYRIVTVYGQCYRAGRLAWFYVYGRWPEGEVDHINRFCDDDRIANLREATRAENLQNTLAHRDNKSGFKGVFSRGQRWAARICVSGQRIGLGSFPTAEAAYAAYLEAARALHPFAPRAT